MKKIFLLTIIFCVARMSYAQCPINTTDDVSVVYLDFEFASSGINFLVHPCKQYSLLNQLNFVPKFRSQYNNGSWDDKTFWCDAGDGSPKFQLFKDQAAAHDFPLNTSGAPQTYALKFELRNSNGTVLFQDGPYNFVVKATTSANNAGFVTGIAREQLLSKIQEYFGGLFDPTQPCNAKNQVFLLGAGSSIYSQFFVKDWNIGAANELYLDRPLPAHGAQPTAV